MRIIRLFHVIKGDVNAQTRYGIWLLYTIFTIFYICILNIIPHSYVDPVGQILMYTDPATMGLFFMGAIILLEKSQRVNCSIAVSPVTVPEYIAGKIFSLLLPALVVSLLVFLLGGVTCNVLSFISIAISTLLFSLCGLFVAVKTNSLNSFSIATVPFELVLCLPAILYQFDYLHHPWWLLHPGIAAMSLLANQSNTESYFTVYTGLSILSLIVWTFLVSLICYQAVKRFFIELGGGKL